jgi:cytochrome c oxidase cbb3-type subunit IV
VTKLLGNLGMNVSLMSVNDWLGVIFSLVAFIGMVAAYVMVFRPKNKDMYESQRGMALDDSDSISMGEK